MHSAMAAEIIAVWEQALGRNDVEKGLVLLAAACPEASPEQLAALALGERDGRLLALRARLFGPLLKALADCPQCASRLEFTLDARDLGESAGAPPLEISELAVGDVRLRFRALDSRDLARAADCADVASARRVLVEGCVIEAHRADAPIPAADLPEEVVSELAACLAATDARAETVLDLQCAECGRHSQVILDIVSFLWTELDSLAKRLLYEVHTLAWAYGWREKDILAMSDLRRRYYLDCVQ